MNNAESARAVTSVQLEAQVILDVHPELWPVIDIAFGKLAHYVGDGFHASITRFVDPYDGTVALIVHLSSSKTHREVSLAIDSFVNEVWWEYMDKIPIGIIWSAED